MRSGSYLHRADHLVRAGCAVYSMRSAPLLTSSPEMWEFVVQLQTGGLLVLSVGCLLESSLAIRSVDSHCGSP